MSPACEARCFSGHKRRGFRTRFEILDRCDSSQLRQIVRYTSVFRSRRGIVSLRDDSYRNILHVFCHLCVIFQHIHISHIHTAARCTVQDIGFRKELTYTRPLRAVESDSDAREHLERRASYVPKTASKSFAPGVGDVSMPSTISNRARRRTEKEVHSAVRTRPESRRLTKGLKMPL